MNNEFEFDNKNNEVSRIKRNFKDDLSGADLRAYQDPAGMSVAKLDLGLWYVENKENLRSGFYFSLALFALLSTIFFLYQFGAYAISGLKLEKAYAHEIATRTLPEYSFYHNEKAQDPQLYPVKIIYGTGDKMDLVSQISNPNQEHWARFKYYFLDNDEKIGYEDGFVLPGETKQLVLLGRERTDNIGGLKLAVEDINWGRINRHAFGDWEKFEDSHLNLRFSNIVFLPSEASMLSEKIPINQLSFYMENRTSYNYWNIPLLISLYNYSDLIGVVSYEVNDMESSEKRDISFTLPGEMRKVTDVKIVPNLDITRPDLYKKQQTGSGSFR